jgi:hypothetical protein
MSTPEEDRTLAAEMTRFIGSPDDVLNPAMADPEFATNAAETVAKHAKAAGYSDAAISQIKEGFSRMGEIGDELLSCLGLG